MGRANKKGWNGVIGRIGNTVTYLRGNTVVSRQVGFPSKPSTIPQLQSRQRLRIANSFLSTVKDYSNLGMAEAAKADGKFPSDVMRSHIMLDGIVGDYPDQKIDFSKIIFSKGSITQTPSLTISQNGGGLEFSWDGKFLPKGARNNDWLMVMVYFPEQRNAYFETNAARRSEGNFQFTLTSDDEPRQMEIYTSFISADSRRVSNSVYMGQLTLPAYIN